MLNIDELEIGQTFSRAGPPMVLEAFREFGSLLGTDAPIHCDPDYAAKTPFGKVFAQGPLLLAPFESWLCDLFGADAWSSGGVIKGKFLVPAMIDSTVGLEIAVRDITQDALHLDLRAVNGQALLAVATAEIPRRS